MPGERPKADLKARPQAGTEFGLIAYPATGAAVADEFATAVKGDASVLARKTRSVVAPTMWTDTSHSLWEATANARPCLKPLETSARADVVVVGAGYLGLSAALTLASRGLDVVVLDAAGPGRGASGRNGGQVIPGLKHDPDQLADIVGPEAAANIIEFAGNAPDRVFELIREHDIQCDPVRKGWIQGAHNAAAMKTIEGRAGQWQRRGAMVELLDASQVTEQIGCAPGLYHGGWIDRRAGTVHPLNYALGLSDAAIRSGARIHPLSVVTSVTRSATGPGARWRVGTGSGAHVDAEQVVLATNGYSDDLWPALRQSIIAVQSFQIATDPLPAVMRAHILRDSPAVSDARRLLHYYRLDNAGRLVMGGRGSLELPRNVLAFEHIRRALNATFPALRRMPIRYRWAGRLAVTPDGMPHLHQPAPGVTIALGCNGRGVALTTAIGQQIGRHLVDGDRAPLPFPASAIRAIPMHGFHKMALSVVIQYYKIRDMI